MAKLYVVEGLPCSGKSTTAGFLADLLAEGGAKAVSVDEGTGRHPADYECSAYVGGEQLPSLPAGLRERVAACAEPAAGGCIVDLTAFRGEEFDALLQYKIYDFLLWETEMPLMLGKWRSFVANAEKDSVYVFNCVFLQNPMCETMMRFGFPEERSLAYITQIAEIAAPMAPTVIYLKNDNISKSILAASKEREGWLDGAVDYHVNGAYGKSIGARGFEGYTACLEERQRRELSILDRLPVKRLVLDNPQRDWGGAYAEIKKYVMTAR